MNSRMFDGWPNMFCLFRQGRRWSLIRRALYRWIHALPSTDDRETHLSVIASSPSVGGSVDSSAGNNKKNLVVLGWTKVTADNRDGLVGRIPRRSHLSSSSQQQQQQQHHHLVSAIQLAHQVQQLGRRPFVCDIISNVSPS